MVGRSEGTLVLCLVLANTPMESNGQGRGAWSSLFKMCHGPGTVGYCHAIWEDCVKSDATKAG